jgi:hypothetical protein
MAACTALIGDFQSGATSDGGGGSEAGMGSEAATESGSGSETGSETGDGSEGGPDATADGSDATAGMDAMEGSDDTGAVVHDAAPDHSSPPPEGGTDAGMTIHGDGTFQLQPDFPFASGPSLGPSPTSTSGTLGPAPTGLIAADLNKDGVPDLAACTDSGIVVLVSRNGSLVQVETSDNSITNCVGLAAFDQNNDGYPELAVIQSSPPTLYVFTNQGGYNFYISASQYTPGPTVLSLSSTPKFVAADDFNRDGVVDVAVTLGASIQLYTNLYPATFGLQFAATINTYEGAGDVVFRDLNGDTFPDAIVGASAYNAYAFSAEQGPSPATPFFSTLGAALNYGGNPYPPTTAMPLGVTTGDFDGDGLFDVAVANQGTNDVTAFYNLDTQHDVNLSFRSGSSTYNPPHYPVGSSPYDIASGDFNGDGAWDLVTSIQGSQLALLMGQMHTQALANPAPANITLTGGSTSSIVVGDFNNDHKLDIAALYTTQAAIALLYGN